MVVMVFCRTGGLARIKYIELAATAWMGPPSWSDHDLSLASVCPQHCVVPPSDLGCSVMRKLKGLGFSALMGTMGGFFNFNFNFFRLYKSDKTPRVFRAVERGKLDLRGVSEMKKFMLKCAYTDSIPRKIYATNGKATRSV